MSEAGLEAIREAASTLSQLGVAIGNEIRAAILLRLSCGPAKWSEIRGFLSGLYGFPVNPNALAFHLRRLVESGLVERSVGGESVYELTEEGRELVKQLAPIVRSRGFSGLCDK